PVTSSKEVVNEPVIMEEVVVMPVANPWGYVNLRGGWDFWSEYDGFTFDSDPILSSKTKDFGGEVALEVYKHWDKFDLGLGVAYQDHTERKTVTDSDGYSLDGAEYKSVPVYLTGRYNVNYWDWAVTPYLKANIGYSFNFDSDSISENFEGVNTSYSTSVDDGLYWAAGIGMEYAAFNVDVLYGETQAKSKVDGINSKFDNDYKRVTLSVGYKFDIN
ncbi:MAG: outer membrane beta-barrel protein, partial [Fusobacteriaceae bacterium]